MNFATNKVSSCASRVFGALPQRLIPVTIRWFPGHMGAVSTGANRNEEADRAAHRLTGHGTALSPRPTEGDNGGMILVGTYKEVLTWYRENRRTYPPPHRNLTRREAVLLRQLQARAIWTPVLAKHVCPEVYQSDVCAVCGRDRATMVHMLWECQETCTHGHSRLASAVASTDYNLQREAVQLALAALERQRPNTLPPPQEAGDSR